MIHCSPCPARHLRPSTASAFDTFRGVAGRRRRRPRNGCEPNRESRNGSITSPTCAKQPSRPGSPGRHPPPYKSFHTISGTKTHHERGQVFIVCFFAFDFFFRCPLLVPSSRARARKTRGCHALCHPPSSVLNTPRPGACQVGAQVAASAQTDARQVRELQVGEGAGRLERATLVRGVEEGQHGWEGCRPVFT